MLKKFNQLLHEPLVWKNDGILKRSVTLYHNEQPVAQFRQDHGLLNMTASIYLTGDEVPLFVFRPKGVFKQTLEVECHHVDFAPAKFKLLPWNKGVSITFANGDEYIWKSVNMWGKKWLLTSADGIKVAKLELGRWGSTGTITIVSDHPSPAEMNLLIFTGWVQYLFLMQQAAAAA